MNQKLTAIKLFCGKVLGFAGSQIATGTTNLINDVTTWLYVLVPLAGVAAARPISRIKNSGTTESKRLLYPLLSACWLPL